MKNVSGTKQSYSHDKESDNDSELSKILYDVYKGTAKFSPNDNKKTVSVTL